MPFDPTDPEAKAAIKAAVDEANANIDAKNKELLDDLKKVKAELRSKSEINPADLEKLESENDKLKADLTAAQKTLKDATAAAEKATKALEAEQGVTHKLIAENGLVKALMDSGVTDPAYLEAAKAMHLGSVKVVAEGDTRKALYGDKDVNDAVKEWAASDVGKKFVAAPVNGGGGAGGSNGASGGSKTADSATFNAMGPKDRAAFMASGGTVADQAA